MRRLYFLTHNELADITRSEPRKVKEMCKRGELLYIRWGEDYLIPTAWLRKNFDQLPLYFWQEITEDLYRGLMVPRAARCVLRDVRTARTQRQASQMTHRCQNNNLDYCTNE